MNGTQRRKSEKMALQLAGVSGVPFCVLDGDHPPSMPEYCLRCGRCDPGALCLRGAEAPAGEEDRLLRCPAGLWLAAASLSDADGLSGCLAAGPFALEDGTPGLPGDVPALPHSRALDLAAVLDAAAGSLRDVPEEAETPPKTGTSVSDAARERDPGRRDLWEDLPRLRTLIEENERLRAQALLNEHLTRIFAIRREEPDVFKARVLDLVVALSRVVNDPDSLTDASRPDAADELNIWLTCVLHHFILDVFEECSARHSETVNKIIKYVRQNYSRKLTLDEIAGQVFLSPSYISSLFKEETGQSLITYINHVRVEQSKQLLADQRISLVDIAGMCGFEDQGYFTKVFKRETGLTPNRFRNSRAGNGTDFQEKGNSYNFQKFSYLFANTEPYTRDSSEKGEMTMVSMLEISEFLQKGRARNVKQLVEQALEEGTSPQVILNDALLHGMGVIGEKFKNSVVFVPEVLIAARALNAGLDVLRPKLAESGVEPKGVAVIGTVKGDLHDIGKNIVKIMLEGCGVQVVDLGVDVAAEQFVDAALENHAKLICCSALLTTTMGEMRRVVEILAERGLRDQIHVMVGGAPITQSFCDSIGADGYAADAASGAEKALTLLAKSGS